MWATSTSFKFRHSFQTIERLADDRAQERHSFRPAEPKANGINRDKTCVNVRIVLPVPHQQIRLHRLAADIAQGRSQKATRMRNLRPPRAALRAERRRCLAASTRYRVRRYCWQIRSTLKFARTNSRARAPSPNASLPLLDRRANPCRQRLLVIGRNQQCPPVAAEFAFSSDRGRDHGHSSRHRFQHHIRQTLRSRRHHRYVEARQAPRHIAAVPQN